MTDQTTSSETAQSEAGALQDAEPTFNEALERLEGILQRIESDEIDIDELAQELRTGAELLEICRGKIRKAEVEVTQIVQNLEQDDA